MAVTYRRGIGVDIDDDERTPATDDDRRLLYITINMEQLRFLGSLQGHRGWVTAIATSSENPDMILTASRGAYTAIHCAKSDADLDIVRDV